jgi:hypothetical protein
MSLVEFTLKKGRKATFNPEQVIAVVENHARATLYTTAAFGGSPSSSDVTESYADAVAKLTAAT